MNAWRKIVVFTLMLIMPMSSWAVVTMKSGCSVSGHDSYSMTAQMDDNDAIHQHEHNYSQDTFHSSDNQCEDNVSCSVSICSATALFESVSINLNDTSRFTILRNLPFAHPSDPTLPFRPPIFFS